MTNEHPYINNPIQCLDHGSVTLLNVMGDDKAIEHAARVSFTGGEVEEVRTIEQTTGLLRYLLRHRHTTPFEMVVFQFRIVLPIFVWRQWIRHRTASVNEISGRYQVLPDLYYVPEVERIRYQHTSNKQGSGDDVMEHAEHERLVFQNEQRSIRERYDNRIDGGMAKELARINLPVSQYTSMVWKMDLHNLLHFLALRIDGHAQEEIRVYANAIGEVVKAQCPIAWQAFEDYRLHSMSLTRQDLACLAEIGTPAGEAAGYVLAIREAVKHITTAKREGVTPDATKAAAATYWPTTREALEFADKIERLFCTGEEFETAVPAQLPGRKRKHYTAGEVVPLKQRVLVLDEKHGHRYLVANTDDQLHASALKVISERVDRWYVGDEQDEADARKAIATNDGKLAWRILQRRNGAEYEDVSLEVLES